MKNRRLLCALLLLSVLTLPARGEGIQNAEAPLTRGQFLLLLWESQGALPFDRTAHPFSDLPEDGQAQAAAWAWQEGLVRGVGGGLFLPGRPLTREECAVLLRRLDTRLGRDTFLPDGPSLCNDQEGVSPWAGDDLYWACITGRMGWQNSRLAPQGTVTPAQAEKYLSGRG